MRSTIRSLALSVVLGVVAFVGARFGLANLFTAIDILLLSASLSFLWYFAGGILALGLAGGLIHLILKRLHPDRREFMVMMLGGLVCMNVLGNLLG